MQIGKLTQIFSPFYWKAHVTETQEIVDRYLSKIEANTEKKPVMIPSDWQCTIHSSYMSNDPEVALDTEWLNKIYAKYVTKFLDELKLKDCVVSLTDPWYNSFTNNQFQEPHTHLPTDFSIVHYLLFDEKDHEATTFVNPDSVAAESQRWFRPELYSKLNSREPMHSYYNSQFTPLDIKQGDLVIFPASLTHFVKPNRSEKRRITITLNALVHDMEQLQYMQHMKPV